MNPIARALASKALDSPRKAALFELLPLVAFVVLASLDALAWLVFDQTDLPTVVTFVLGLAGVAFGMMSLMFSVLSGLGWMGRGHNWVGGAVLLLRVALSFAVFTTFVATVEGSVGQGDRAASVFLLLLAAWIAMPILSAWLVAIVDAREQDDARVPTSNI